MKRFRFICGSSAVFALALSLPAFALEEQRLPVAPQQASPSDAAKSGLAPGTAKTEGGTEVRIPGLGKLGTLPKMDFGLELLYGASENKAPTAPAIQDPADSDLTIHGSVKHSF